MAGKKNVTRRGAGARRSDNAMNDESLLFGSQLDPVDAARAVQLGQFVSLAYSMYGSAPTNPAPNPPPALPFGYIFAAWVQMRDFIFELGDLTFYGLIAHSPDGSDVILAIRGTETAEEWWDDITSLYPTTWTGPGKIGYGFGTIYKTLKVVPYGAMATAAASGPMQSAAPPPPFAKQVADLVARIPPHWSKPTGPRRGARGTPAHQCGGPQPRLRPRHSVCRRERRARPGDGSAALHLCLAGGRRFRLRRRLCRPPKPRVPGASSMCSMSLRTCKSPTSSRFRHPIRTTQDSRPSRRRRAGTVSPPICICSIRTSRSTWAASSWAGPSQRLRVAKGRGRSRPRRPRPASPRRPRRASPRRP